MIVRIGNRSFGLVISLSARVIVPLISILLIPVYLKYLSKEEYGIWLVILGIVNYLALAKVGIAQTIGVRVAQLNGPKHYEVMSSFASTAWVLSIKFVAAFIVILTTGALYFSKWISSNYFPTFIVLSLFFFASIPLQLYSVSLRALDHIAEEQVFNIVSAIFRFVAVTILLFYGAGLAGLSLAHGLAILLPMFLAKWRLRQVAPFFQINWTLSDSKFNREILGHSAGFFVLQVAGLIAFSTDNIVIAGFLGPAVVPDYAVPAQIIFLIQSFALVAIAVFQPLVARYFEEKRFVALQVLYQSMLFVLLAGGLTAALILFLTASPLIELWLGGSISVDKIVLVLLLVLMFVHLSLAPADLVIVSTLSHKRFAYIGLTEAIVNLGLSIWWVQLFGTPGVVAATIVGRLFISGIYMNYKAPLVLGMRFVKVIQIYLLIMLAGIGVFTFSYFATNVNESTTSSLTYSIFIILGLVVFLAIFGRNHISQFAKALRAS